jgi:hypothetical protein
VSNLAKKRGNILNITVRHRTKVDVLRKQPESVSRFGIVAQEINRILYRHGYEMISAVPKGSLEMDMAYIDIDSQELFDNPAGYPLELQMGLYEVDTLDIEIEDDEIVRSEFKELDMDAEFHYQTFGWAEELLAMWRLASRASNISLKQIRIALNSVAGIHNSAHIQFIKDSDTNPKLETLILKTVDGFMSACEDMDELGVDVANVLINKPIPRSKSTIPISYTINPSKYINMKVRDMG